MNKYDIMSNVLPPLTTAQMANNTYGYNKGGTAMSKWFKNLLKDTDVADEWQTILNDFMESKAGTTIKKYVPKNLVWWNQKGGLDKIDPEFNWDPNVKAKELFWEMPEGVTKKEDIFFDPLLPINKKLYPESKREHGAWRGDPSVVGQWQGAQDFLDNYKGEFGDLEWQKNFGRMYQNVAYNEYDAFSDTLEHMLNKQFKDEIIDEKSFTDMNKIINDLRYKIERYKVAKKQYDDSPPQYKSDMMFFLKEEEELINDTLSRMGNIFETQGGSWVGSDTKPKTLNSRGGIHGYSAGGSVGKYFVREPVKKIGKFLKDNVPPVFSSLSEYIPKLTGTKTKLSARLNEKTNLWDIGNVSGKKKDPNFKFEVIEEGFKDQKSANKALKKRQAQQVTTPSKPAKSEGALVWRSREAIENAPFQTAPKKQWLQYLLSRNVGYKELGDTSLFLTKTGKDDAGNDIRIPEGGFLGMDSDARISKVDFMKEFDELAPKIQVHLLGNRNFFDGLKYLDESTTATGTKKRTGYQGAIEDVEGTTKYYKDYPRADFDTGFEGLLKQVSGLVKRLKQSAGSRAGSGRQEEGAEAFDKVMVENAVEQINAAFKMRYGVDDVVGKGINSKDYPGLPFEVVKLGNSIADVFSKRGVQYKVTGQPQHEGDQILQGGYNHNYFFHFLRENYVLVKNYQNLDMILI